MSGTESLAALATDEAVALGGAQSDLDELGGGEEAELWRGSTYLVSHIFTLSSALPSPSPLLCTTSPSHHFAR